MLRRQTLVFILLALLSGALHASGDAETETIVKDFSLGNSAATTAALPGWKPQRVVIVLPASFETAVPDARQRFAAAAQGVELVFIDNGSFTPSAEQLAGADALVGICTPDVMAAADEGFLWLHNYSVGIDRCAGLSEQLIDGRIFSNSKRLSGPGIADHAIAMTLALARNFPAFFAAQAQQNWQRGLSNDMQFGELRGKTLLVVGLGGIGTEVARRAHGLGMRVVATRNSSRKGPPFVDYVGLSDELHKLAGESHVIVNALPLTAKTTSLFDADFFAAARDGAIFVSVGRGRSTDTDALIAALQSGKLYGAGLDVTDPEPLPADHPLWQQSNVIITPHISASGAGTARRIVLVAIENLRRYTAGEALLNPVDLRKGY